MFFSGRQLVLSLLINIGTEGTCIIILLLRILTKYDSTETDLRDCGIVSSHFEDVGSFTGETCNVLLVPGTCS